MAVGIGGALLAALADWALWLPGAVRAAVDIVLVGVVAWVAVRRVVWPLVRPVSLTAIAMRIERQYPEFDDRLSSAVAFHEQPESSRSELQRRVIERAEHQIRATDLGRVWHFERLRRSALAAVAATACGVAAVGIGGREWVRTAVARYAAPLGAVEWPRQVEIVPLTGDLTVAMGERAVVRMRLARSPQPDLRAYVAQRRGSGAVVRTLMARRGEGLYEAVFDSVVGDFEYWFEAGDDTTASSPGRVRVVRRPGVASAYALVKPPAYLGGAEPVRVSLKEGALEVPAGSEVTLVVRTTKPLGVRDDGAPAVSVEASAGDGPEVVAEDASAGRFRLVGRVDGSVRWRVQVEDAEGFSSREPVEFRIVAVPDRPPRVVVLEPTSLSEVTPGHRLVVRAAVEDDHGLREARLRASVRGRESGVVVPMDLAAGGEEAGGGVVRRGEARVEWALASLGLRPGEVVEIVVEAEDNCTSGEGGARGQVGRSAPVVLPVVSEGEYVDRLGVRLQLLALRLRDLMLEEGALAEQTGAQREAAGSGEAVPASRVRGLAGRQQQVAVRAGGIAEELRLLAEGYRAGSREHGADARAVERAGRDLEALAERELAGIAQRLQGVVQAPAGRQAEALREAEDRQAQAVAAMRALLGRLEQMGSLQAVARKAQQILDAQERLTQATAAVGRETLGRRPETLPESQRDRLGELARAQEEVAREAGELLERMAPLAEALEGSQPVVAEALRDAESRARSADLTARLREAGEAIRENQIAAAQQDQRRGEDVLREVVGALEQREQRELEWLSRVTGQFEETLGYLLEQQKQLRESTRRAGGSPEILRSLWEHQERLARNARGVAEDMRKTVRLAPARGHVLEAQASMDEAAAALNSGVAEAAEGHQGSAIMSLQRALDTLATIRREAARERALAALEAIRRQLEALRDGQAGVRKGAEGLVAVWSSGSRPGREALREAAGLVYQQRELTGQADRLRESLSRAPAHAWVLERVVEDMRESGVRMGRRRFDASLLGLQDRILGRLDALLESIDEEAMNVEDAYAAGESPAGEGASGTVMPVPNLAQLRLLRRLQIDLNAEVRALAERLREQPPTEEDLRQVQELGARQRELRDLAEKLMEGAQP